MSVTWPKAIALAVIAAMVATSAVIAGVGLGGEGDAPNRAPADYTARQRTSATAQSRTACDLADLRYVEAVRHQMDRAGRALTALSRTSAGDPAWDAAVDTLWQVSRALGALQRPGPMLADAHETAGELAGVLRRLVEDLDDGYYELVVARLDTGSGYAALLHVQLDNACR